eukprot:CAMPEP_0185003468 /NCGR_PEP_ID=MMETSP1098-20130426/76570_1 /TAXON_ID=89044 /ORGANISM="Spumella elongata, Strain CCAP 955/1" /LENGTH=59 /DNA_ID=CAMNT_0027531133 /DNA_START=4 /DNA_END=179 /DNA_ORIENTATION=-
MTSSPLLLLRKKNELGIQNSSPFRSTPAESTPVLTPMHGSSKSEGPALSIALPESSPAP